MAVFVKNDLWLNHLIECNRRNIPMICASAVFRLDQIYFNRAKALYQPLLKAIDHYFVQDLNTQRVLERNHIHNATVAGDNRVDRVISILDEPLEDPLIEDFVGQDRPVIIFGSVWPSDLSILKRLHHQLEDYFFIVAPHDTKNNQLRNALLEFPEIMFYSEGKKESARMLVLDKVGLLSRVYRYGRYAYVGGAFHSGVHNTLEPAVYGIPVFVGDDDQIYKFHEVRELVKTGGIKVTDQEGDEMLNRIQLMDGEEERYARASEANSVFIEEQSGATEMVVDYLKDKLK